MFQAIQRPPRGLEFDRSSMAIGGIDDDSISRGHKRPSHGGSVTVLRVRYSNIFLEFLLSTRAAIAGGRWGGGDDCPVARRRVGRAGVGSAEGRHRQRVRLPRALRQPRREKSGARAR